MKALLALAAAFLLLGATPAPTHSAKPFSNSLANAAKNLVDTKFVPLVRSFDPKLSVTPATCPSDFNPTATQTAYCTVTVDGKPVSVGLHYDKSKKWLSFVDSSFYELDRVENLEAHALKNDYDVDVKIACSGDRFQLLPVGTEFTCAATGSPKVAEVRFRADANGELFMYTPAGLSAPAWITTAIEEHNAGKPTILDGPTVSLFIKNVFDPILDRQIKPSNVAYRCGDTVDVSRDKHGTCIVTVDGHDVRWDVVIDQVKGVDAKNIDVILSYQYVEKIIQDDFNTRLAKLSKSQDAVVHCPTGLVVVTPPSDFTCTATGGGGTYDVQVTIKDRRGAAEWLYKESTTSPSATD
jgi:hypothetical protein